MKNQRTKLGGGKPRIDIAEDVAWRTKQAARELRGRETPSEQLLWDALRNRRFDGLKFRRQQAIGPFVVDFYCAELRLVIEVDGSIHDAHEQRTNDASRQQAIESADIRFIRVRVDLLVNDLPAALASIRAAIHERNVDPSSPLPLRERGRG